MHTLQCVVSAVCSTALVAAPIAAAAFAVPAPASADEPWTVVPEETLRDMRGGIDLGALVANFAIMRVVQVDGVVVARMQIVISNLERLGNGGMPTISLSGPSAELVQIMNAAGNAGGVAGSALNTTPASGAAASTGTSAATATIAPTASPAVSAPAAVSAPPESASVAAARSNQSSAPSSTSQLTSSTGNAGTVSAAGTQSGSTTQFSNARASTVATASGGALQPTGSVAAPSTPSSSGPAGPSAATAPAAGTTQIVPLGSTGQVAVLSNLPNATALTTAIQNNVRAATIQVQTTISATLNSLALLNASALASSIRQQVSKGP